MQNQHDTELNNTHRCVRAAVSQGCALHFVAWSPGCSPRDFKSVFFLTTLISSSGLTGGSTSKALGSTHVAGSTQGHLQLSSRLLLERQHPVKGSEKTLLKYLHFLTFLEYCPPLLMGHSSQMVAKSITKWFGVFFPFPLWLTSGS